MKGLLQHLFLERFQVRLECRLDAAIKSKSQVNYVFWKMSVLLFQKNNKGMMSSGRTERTSMLNCSQWWLSVYKGIPQRLWCLGGYSEERLRLQGASWLALLLQTSRSHTIEN